MGEFGYYILFAAYPNEGIDYENNLKYIKKNTSLNLLIADGSRLHLPHYLTLPIEKLPISSVHTLLIRKMAE